MITQNNIDIMLVGSSIIKRWMTIHDCYNKSTKIINLGINGVVTKDLINDEYLYAISKYKPKNIIYYCGGNDVREGIQPSIIIKNIKDFVKGIRNIYKNEVNIIFISLLKNPITYGPTNIHIDIINKYIAKYMDKYIHLHFLDINEYINDSKYFMKDHIHLTKNGYKILDKKIVEFIPV